MLVESRFFRHQYRCFKITKQTSFAHNAKKRKTELLDVHVITEDNSGKNNSFSLSSFINTNEVDLMLLMQLF